jgi:hypothetical protein
VQVQLTSQSRPLEISRTDRDKLIRRIGNLDSARSVVTRFEGAAAARPVELADDEKGFLVVAIKAWMQDAGQDRVPGGLIRLRDGLLDDLSGVTPIAFDEAMDEGNGPDDPADEPHSSTATEDEARSRLLHVAEVIEQELAALRDLDDARLGPALDAMEQTAREIAAVVADPGSSP